MEYNQCQKDMIYYVIDYSKNAEGKLAPCVEFFKQIFRMEGKITCTGKSSIKHSMQP